MNKPIPKIYTRFGDTKKTGILSGARLSKHSTRIEAIGSLDELNSFLGFLLSMNEQLFRDPRSQSRAVPIQPRTKIHFKKIIEDIQRDLFIMGSDLSQPLIRLNAIPHLLYHHYHHDLFHQRKKIPQISHMHIHKLEKLIDHFQNQLPPLKNFILPQGKPVGAFLQVVRTICRRTERRVVQLAIHSKINPLIMAYLNRLSDLFFVLARAVNYKSKKVEVLWKYE